MVWVDALLVLVVFTGFTVLGGTRLIACVKRVALQGALIGVVGLVLHAHALSPRLVAVALAAIVAKGIVFPLLLTRSVRESSARRDAGGFVRPGTSLVIGLGLLGVSFWLGRRLPLEHAAHVFALSVGFFGLFSGVFLIVARRTALMQALGYLVLENGIYLVGATLVAHTPFLLEVGLLLDVVLAVLVMGATIFRMNRELEHMDTEQLLKLQG